MNAPQPGGVPDRLNWLFDVVRPEADRVYTAQEVAQAVSAAQGTGDSRALADAITELRSGGRRGPSQPELDAIAEFFGTSATYFSGDDQDLTEAQTRIVWSELRRGGVNYARMCRTEDLDRTQRLAIALILLGCLRSDAPTPTTWRRGR